MIFIKSKKDLKKKSSLIPNDLIPKIEEDLTIIEEEYPKYDDKFVSQYGPIVVLLDRSERTELKRRMPVVRQLVSEYEEIVLKDKDSRIKKKLYVLTESGIILYERFKKWGND